MFPIVAAIFGFVVGLLASPNPVAGVMCGGAFGVIAWALTGFKIGNNASASRPVSVPTRRSTPTVALSGSSTAKFEVADSMFSKASFSPREFGAELVPLSFSFAVEQFEKHLFAEKILAQGFPQSTFIRRQPGACQVLLAALIAGAGYAYIQVILNADRAVLDDVEAGFAEGFKKQVPTWSSAQAETHAQMAVNFGEALEQEVRETFPDASIKLFLRYMSDAYSDQETAAQDFSNARGLIAYLSGFGTRCMAVHQNIFNVRLKT